MIVRNLHDHKDIANFSLICKETNNAVEGDNFSFWRAKFREDFVMLDGKSNEQLRRRYKYRWAWINKAAKQGFAFRHGNTSAEKAILKVLKDLIVESFANGVKLDDEGQPECLNMAHLKEFVFKSKLFLCGSKRPPILKPNEYHNTSLIAVRIMLAQFLFDGAAPSRSWFAMDDAQKAVYAATNTAPIFLGLRKNMVNVEWIFHCLNFFRYYMTDSDHPLFDTIEEELGPSGRPSPWREPLKSGSYPLAKHWQGTYSFLEHTQLARFRTHPNLTRRDSTVADRNVNEGKIQVRIHDPPPLTLTNNPPTQSLTLDFSPPPSLPWPPLFERRLNSRRVTKPGPNPPDIRFDGQGTDLDDPFFATGWLNALPPQCDIPGWQRISFMKHFEEDLHEVGQDDLWAYEGVVVPGGRMILGRWWFASVSGGCGVVWCALVACMWLTRFVG